MECAIYQILFVIAKEKVTTCTCIAAQNRGMCKPFTSRCHVLYLFDQDYLGTNRPLSGIDNETMMESV